MSGILSVLVPTEIEPAMLVSSTVSETEEAVWNSVSTYALGARCLSPVTHRIYESAKAGNTNHDPTDITNRAGSTIWWIDVSPTNRWTMFNSKSSAQTETASPLTVVLKPGAINALYLSWIDADEITVTVKSATGGDVVFTQTAQLECSYPADFYEFCFAPYKQQTDILIENIPTYYSPEVTVTLTRASGNVKCGSLQVGDLVPLGRTLSSPKSKPKGNSYIGANSNNQNEVKTRKRPTKDITVSALVELDMADTVLEKTTALIDVPCLWAASSSPKYSGLRSFGLGVVELSYDHTQHCVLNLTVNGITT